MHFDKLRKDYPDFFNDIEIECDSGWYELIDQLAHDLEVICIRDGIKLKVLQVKEKLGGLRFYVDHDTDETDSLIRKTEEKSFHICERCGREGRLGYIRNRLSTRCPQCLPVNVINNL